MKTVKTLTLASTLLCSVFHGAQAAQPAAAKELFGKTEAGQDIYRYTLTNRHGVSVRFIDFGGIITTIEIPDRKGRRANVVLGFSTLADYVKYNKDIHFGAVLGRYANRIANGQFRVDGKQYQLAINDPPNTLHSGPDNFGVKHWVVEPSKDGHSAILTYTSPAGEAGFPGKLDVKVTYSLDDKNDFHIVYQAQTDAATIVNLTNHSYFNLKGEGKGSVEGHIVSINASHYVPTDGAGIPTGELASVTGTPFDLRKPKAIGAGLRSNHPQMLNASGYDKSFVVEGGGKGKLVKAATIYEPVSGRLLEISTTQPGIQFYTANGLKGNLAGTSGTAYRSGDAFALETQHFPDAPNQPKFESTLLRPGETFHQEAVFHFGVRR